MILQPQRFTAVCHTARRYFAASARRREIRDIAELPPRTYPTYKETQAHDLLGIEWSRPPQNVLLIKKDNTPHVTEAFLEYARHIDATYPATSIVLPSKTAEELHEQLPFPVFTSYSTEKGFENKVDLMSTLGGDGTILRASSLFSSAETVPPLLAFSMGTLGFLGEWKFEQHKQAFREVYMSGAQRPLPDAGIDARDLPRDWPGTNGKHMGNQRNSRVLLRSRLKVGVFDAQGQRVNSVNTQTSAQQDVYALNEVIIHRGADPHLAIVEVFVGDRFLTEAIADGMIVSTPTGSTAYSLSCGGNIVHPLVPSVLLTPICPRSLSFRPLVLPRKVGIKLRLSEKNRGREVDISIDGVRRSYGVGVGMELRVSGEEVQDNAGNWVAGVPCIVRGHTGSDTGSEESWVGGLNSLLKFNYPLGES